MDAARYYLALALLVLMPPALLHWFIVHPFVRFWRRLGPGLVYTLVWTPLALLMALLYRARGVLLATEYGTRWPLVIAGGLLLAAGIGLAIWVRRWMSVAMLLGLPEIAPDRAPATLVTGGPYAHVRHPRYLEVSVGLLGYALITNYLATWVLYLFALPALYAVVVLEERELRERFGAAYAEYCRRVPRFIPRLRR
jgi:protein-S-isoprenylcysteine O-methyltransferase Ste14